MNLEEVNKIGEFVERGVNRISVGVQSLDRQTLLSFNRGAERLMESIEELAAWSSKINLNLDFIIDLNCSSKN